MPQLIDIGDGGPPVEFPDDMSDDQIAAAIKNSVAQKPAPTIPLMAGAPPTAPQNFMPSTMPPPTPQDAAVQAQAQLAQETGPFDAAMIAAGRTGDRWLEGGKDILQMPASLMGDPNAIQDRAQRAQTQAGNDAAFGPLGKEHPIATTLGGGAPYALLPSGGVAGNVMLPGAMGLLEYGTPQERLQRGALAAGAGYGANALARSIGGRAVDTGDQYLDDVVKKGQKLGFQPLPSQMSRQRGLQAKEARFESNPRTANIMGDVAEGNKRRLTEIAAESIGLKDVNRLTPGHLQRARDQIGAMFDESAKGVNVGLTDDFKAQTEKVFYDYIETPGRASDKSMSNRIATTVDDILKKKNLTADEYLKFTSDLAKDARGLRSRGENAGAEALEDLRSALDSAFDSNAGDLPKLKVARDQWRSLLMIEQSVDDAGDVSFKRLSGQLRKNDKWGYVRGNRERELYDALRFHNSFPAAFGSSGTAERSGAAPSFVSSILDGMARGAGVGYMAGQPQVGMALGGALGAARPITDPLAAKLYTSKALNKGLLDMSPKAQGLLGRTLTRAGLLAVSPKLQANDRK